AAAEALPRDDAQRGAALAAHHRGAGHAAAREPDDPEHAGERERDPEDQDRRRRVSQADSSSAGGRPGVAADDLGDADAVLLVDDDDLAARHETAVDHDVGGCAGRAVELEDGAGHEDRKSTRLNSSHVKISYA